MHTGASCWNVLVLERKWWKCHECLRWDPCTHPGLTWSFLSQSLITFSYSHPVYLSSPPSLLSVHECGNKSLLTLLSPYSSIEQYFNYFPHNQLSLPLFSFHLHPITLPPRSPPASPSAILLPLWTKSNAAKLFGEFSPTKPMLPSLSSLRGTAVPK